MSSIPTQKPFTPKILVHSENTQTINNLIESKCYYTIVYTEIQIINIIYNKISYTKVYQRFGKYGIFSAVKKRHIKQDAEMASNNEHNQCIRVGLSDFVN